MKHVFRWMILMLCVMACGPHALAQTDTVYITHRNYYENGAWQVDTLLYPTNERGQFLYGTTVLPSSRRMAAASQGYWLSHVTKEPCSEEGKGEEMIHSDPVVTLNDSILTIDLTITDNCCFDFLCDISFSNEGDLRLYTTGYGSFCACYCCFGLRFHIVLHEYHQPCKRIYLEDHAEPIWTSIE
jgi:hypothetical protein